MKLIFRNFVLPLLNSSQADQEYAIEASYRALFSLPKSFDDPGNGGIIITSVKGKVSVIHAPRYTGSKALLPEMPLLVSQGSKGILR